MKYYDADYATTEAGLYILIEFMSGNSIKNLLDITDGKFDEKITSIYTKQILRGLKELHSLRIKHMNLKSSNILIDSDGTIKICDYGIKDIICQMYTSESFSSQNP